MITETINGQVKLTASPGMVLTEAGAMVGRELWLGESRKPEEFSEMEEPAEETPEAVQG